MTELTKRNLDNAIETASSETRLWDTVVPSLFARIKPSGAATFYIQYGSPLSGKKIRHKIGRYGAITLDEARRLARKALGLVADGRDPSQERKAAVDKQDVPTFEAFALAYLEDCRAGTVLYRGRAKSAATIAIDEGRVHRHLIPLLGKRDITGIAKADVLTAMHAIQSGKTADTIKTKPRGVARVTGGAGTARRTIGLLGSIFSHAIRTGLRTDNPVHGIERSKDGRRTRFLTPEEYAQLGKALDELEQGGSNPFAIAAIRLLALTGCRKTEVLSLTHDAVDRHAGCLRLKATKSGPQVRAIGGIALELIDNLTVHERFIFPASRGTGPLVGLPRIFTKACEKAGLDDVTLHTLRHSYASTALELEFSELTIAMLLGHTSHSTTSRYAHHVDRVVRAAADRVCKLIAQRMGMTGVVCTVVSLQGSA
jgi:integrase